MHDIKNYQVFQLISSAIGFFLTISGAIARLIEWVNREQFISVSFVSLIFLIVIPFFIEYVVRRGENEENENQSYQQKETVADYRREEDTNYSC
jgi:hypothetical protein